MIEHVISHHIQKYIIDVLMYRASARFSELRPPKTDTNLFTYHLKQLLKEGFLEKDDRQYRLSTKGMSYVDRVSTQDVSLRTQPKIITMLVIQNSEGELLIWQRKRQPFIDSWTLPMGKLHIEDASVQAAAQREAFEKLGIENAPVVHAGDCYIRVTADGEPLSTTLAHIFKFETDDLASSDRLQWVQPHKLGRYELAPAVEEIVARTFFNDPFYFEEFETEWQAA